MRKGFSLVEMLVVIGILAILIGIGMNTFSGATRKAQQARAQALVSDVATALESILIKEGSFPRKIMSAGESGHAMDENMAYELARRKAMSLSYEGTRTVGADRCGVVSPWAQDVIKRNKDADYSTAVPSGGNVGSHRVWFAVDVDGDGYVNLPIAGGRIRAVAVAWCCGSDGGSDGNEAVRANYTEGRRRGCSYSWSREQVERQ